MEDQRKYYQPLTPVNDNLLCKICNKIAINALECVQCESLYCESCVQVRKLKKNKCPEEECLGEFQTKQPHRLVKLELSQVQFQCINRQQGCQEELKINNVIQHAAICQYATEKCKCGWQGRRTDFQNHEKNCPLLATQSCPTCKEQILLSKFMKHNCVAELKDSLAKVSEKFFDYKESSEFAIKELKNQFSHQILEIQDIKHHQAVIIAEQHELKEALQKLLALFQQQEQKLKEAINQQDQIPESNLREAFTLKCPNNHDLYYWFNPKGEQRKKKCLKCQKIDVNSRYYCPACKIFLCLKCEPAEIVTRAGQSHCPARHPIRKKVALPQNCAICERSSNSMLKPGGFSCDTCDFAICTMCIEEKRFNSKPQDCPVQ